MMSSTPQPSAAPAVRHAGASDGRDLDRFMVALGHWTKGEIEAQQLRAATRERR